jgi:hypothetical protein
MHKTKKGNETLLSGDYQNNWHSMPKKLPLSLQQGLHYNYKEMSNILADQYVAPLVYETKCGGEVGSQL